jgi:flagellar assembly protein FliH
MFDPSATPVPWVPPEMTGPVVNRRRRIDEAELDAVGRAAWDAGFAEGRAQGLAAAEREGRVRIAALDERIARLDALLAATARPLAVLDADVERELAELACAIARQVVRRELRSDPGQVIAAIRDAVGLLPAAVRDVRVALHPDDAALVRERLGDSGAARAWVLVEDPMITRGGCRVAADNSRVDARVESRVGAVIANVLGDERTRAERTEAGT